MLRRNLNLFLKLTLYYKQGTIVLHYAQDIIAYIHDSHCILGFVSNYIPLSFFHFMNLITVCSDIY